MEVDVYPIVTIPQLRYYYGTEALVMSMAGKLWLDDSDAEGGAIYRWVGSNEEYHAPPRGPCTDEECPCHDGCE